MDMQTKNLAPRHEMTAAVARTILKRLQGKPMPQWKPDEEKPVTRHLVEQLFDLADTLRATNVEGADLVAEAAATLDAYQAGLVLTSPHPLTGFVLATADPSRGVPEQAW